MANGIYNLSSEFERIYDLDYMGESSPHPRSMFSIWQVAPINHNSDLIMGDSHVDKFGRRKDAINNVLISRKVVFTGFVHLIPDFIIYGPYSRPSTVFFSPIIRSTDGNPIVGMSSGALPWDTMLSGILSSKYKDVCFVVKSYESKFIIFHLANICDSESTITDKSYFVYEVSYTLRLYGGHAHLLGEGTHDS